MTNVSKPVIPAEVADAIEWFRKPVGPSPAFNNEQIVKAACTEVPSSSYEAALRTIPFDTLLAALVNGYKRELMGEERAHAAIKKEWLARDRRRHRSEYCDGFADGIEFVLGELSVEIEGVNA